MTSGKSVFVTFEGGEGAGKSTQVQLLRQHLEAAGRRVVPLREPGGTPLGEELRKLLLNSQSLSPRTELMLFLAARSELVQKVIRPALSGGIDVISDRFIDSTVAYQGYGRGIERRLIDSLNAAVIEGCSPDVTVLLDIDPEAGLARASADSSGDAIEGHWQQGLAFEAQSRGDGKRVGGRDRAFHRRVRKGYLEIAKLQPNRWLVLDATLPVDDLAAAVAERVNSTQSPA
jgi:dTMP kinase